MSSVYSGEVFHPDCGSVERFQHSRASMQVRPFEMSTESELDPIFVHASMRSGSTYFFNVLRRNPSLMCFNEAIMDGKRDYARFKEPRTRQIAHAKRDAKWEINHHFLDRPDFDEFIEAWDSVMHLCPEFPELQDYLPSDGVLSAELTGYLAALMKYARSQGKRPVLCEVNSRGRAGALRRSFGGFHIAQYRDPLSQFGSSIRGLIEGRTWSFLAFPVMELGTSAEHPLYRVVPETWRAPALPWRVATRAQHWASDAQYVASIASPRSEAIEKLFRWHLFSWFLTNLAAISYSDLLLDIDKINDDASYRTTFVENLLQEGRIQTDFGDLQKFDRYYDFESFDVAVVCRQVVSAISESFECGDLEKAVRTLGSEAPNVPVRTGIDCLLAKLHESIVAMAKNGNRQYMRTDEWRVLVEKNRRIWFNPIVRRVAENIYPVAAPVVHVARRVGLWH